MKTGEKNKSNDSGSNLKVSLPIAPKSLYQYINNINHYTGSIYNIQLSINDDYFNDNKTGSHRSVSYQLQYYKHILWMKTLATKSTDNIQ